MAHRSTCAEDFHAGLRICTCNEPCCWTVTAEGWRLRKQCVCNICDLHR